MKILQKNKDITSLSNFKTPAIARYYFEINNLDDVDKLSKIINFSEKENLKILFIGGGTNMLFAFDLFKGVIIKNNLNGWEYNKKSKILKAYSNELISDIAENLEKDYNQNLWHRFIGLPGSFGGAVYGNAGCFGLETENNFREATVYNLSTGKIEILSKKEMLFNYRTSILKQNNNKYFLIKSVFDLSTKIEKYHSDVDTIDFRENKQPKGNTCGSFFKNPNREQSAGFLIEQVGLKGYNIGGASFSEKHANFLMSDGTATYKDLLNLIELAKNKVLEKFGIEIENEVRIIKN
ncbi:MAG: UDP-N-acetylmuramate dehydrogenase [Candidatus Gracilibacteria bacterium]|nr:UDP-N-acetylmuramate dehydrogenase [Candidatus Gracilibacteria bacterium]MDQ7022311.1 UDP-N-acetylmuramate dehydrogenase [Candidatus Gracilibacteria bacterium]